MSFITIALLSNCRYKWYLCTFFSVFFRLKTVGNLDTLRKGKLFIFVIQTKKKNCWGIYVFNKYFIEIHYGIWLNKWFSMKFYIQFPFPMLFFFGILRPKVVNETYWFYTILKNYMFCVLFQIKFNFVIIPIWSILVEKGIMEFSGISIWELK